jgi:hypothetical protein
MVIDIAISTNEGGPFMPRLLSIPIAGVLMLTACNSTKQPSAENFTRAINQYLTKHGEVCTTIGRQFPIDVPQSEQREQNGIVPKLAALEQVGLVRANDTTAVVHRMLDPLTGPTPPQPVKRYELTAEGSKYLQQIPSTLGQTSGLCYGQKNVDAIVKWTEPAMVGTSSQTEVIYTYKIVDSAVWAERPEVQRTFSDIRATVAGASKTTAVVGLQLTNKGWEVPTE